MCLQPVELGDKTIFPFILWQIYFVGGCFLGKETYQKQKISPQNISNWFLISIPILFLAMFIKHGKMIPPTLTSKFPLNALGLFYGTAILIVIYTFTLKYWGLFLGKIKLFNSYVPTFGRNSLLAFVIHVYTAKIILVLNSFYNLNYYTNFLLIAVSIILIYLIIKFHEGQKAGKTILAQGIFVKNW